MDQREHSIQLIKKYYNAFNQRDMPTFLSLLDDNVIHDINQGTREIGKQIFAKFMENINQYYHENLTDIVLMVNEDGTRVGAEYIVHGKYEKSAPDLPAARGQTYTLPGGAFFEIKNHKITRITNYYNVQNWLDMVK